MKFTLETILACLVISVYSGLLDAQTFTVDTLAGPNKERRDGTGTAASFYSPTGVAVDASGNVYVADSNNHMIRKITSAGVVTTLAGSGSLGSSNGTGATASFSYPSGVAVDASGNVYVADGHMIRKITSAGVVSTLAGSTTSGSANGTGTAASFNLPFGVAVDVIGNVYVADFNNHMIRKITSTGVVTTLAGSTTSGSANGTGTAASFNLPYGVAVDASGNVYVADYNNHMIRKISSAGVVATLAGSTTSGSTNGTGTAASFNSPTGVAVDASGNVYVADRYNHIIRKVSSAGVVTTLAGSTTSGSANGTGTAASFSNPGSVAVDAAGNVYVADGNHMIRMITSSGVVSTLAGSAWEGSANGTGTAASFNDPRSVAVDASGNVYVADYNNHMIRKITSTGVVTTLAGSTTSGSTNGTGTAASFNLPHGVAVDASGNVYVADSNNHMIRKITSAGVVTTLAGSTTSGSANGTAASFNLPYGVAVDASGNVYVADSNNHMIRKITSAGVVTTLAGSTTSGSANGTGTAASFSNPTSVAVDASGNVYVADTYNHMIRKITSAGVVTTLAGPTFGSGLMDRFNYPSGVAVDASGNVYVADTASQVIRKITAAGVVTYVAGTEFTGSTNGTGSAARFFNPFGVAVDASGSVFVADRGNHMIRKCTPPLADRAVIDEPVGFLGHMRLLQTSHNTATSWRWEWIRHPSASAATLSSTSISNPTFTPDIEDTYIWRLYAEGPTGTSISEVTLVVNDGMPVLSMKTSLPYSAGSGAKYLDISATVQDADSTNFNTGNLTVTNTRLSEDNLKISSSGMIRLNGFSVEYDATGAFTGSEVVIGNVFQAGPYSADGLNGENLIITLNSNCTPAIAQELLRNVQYDNTLATPDTTPRSIKITVTDDTSLISNEISILLFAPSSGGSSGGGDKSGCVTRGSSNTGWIFLLSVLGLVCISRPIRSMVQAAARR